jgi:glycogen debranching enzyme
MISLEGLTLTTGRWLEAGYILRTFAYYVRDGLIPNMFPDGAKEGRYNTADATMWFFHAVHRYIQKTKDYTTLKLLLPVLIDIIEHHLRGTLFHIGVDPEDGLLAQGEEGYQLTWMAGWLHETGDEHGAALYEEHADKARNSFNQRFWYNEGGYLYDVVDCNRQPGTHDISCRPNQIFAISLDHPVLDQERWASVLKVVQEKLVTPLGLRSLAPNDPEYKPIYSGDLRSRDGAYHQGTVWAWLIGPFIDAWLQVHPDDKRGAREFLRVFPLHLSDNGVGTISEVFDAREPHLAGGCIAQAWSVAEVLRCWANTES